MEMPTINPEESLDSFLTRMLKSEEVREHWPDEDARIGACMAHLRKQMGDPSKSQKKRHRRIVKAMPNFISLVPKGANQLPVIYKSDEEAAEFRMVTKDMNDEGELLAIVYAPEMEDSQGDIADAEVIKDMAYEFQRAGGEIDIRHNGKAVEKEDAFIAESFIVQKGDSRFDGLTDYNGNLVKNVEGSWAVLIKVENEELRKLYREGEWAGVSMAGPAQVESLEKANGTKTQRLLRDLTAHLGMKNTFAHQNISLSGEIDMTAEELTKALEASNKTLLDGITAHQTDLYKQAGLVGDNGKAPPANTAETTEVSKEKQEAPVFKGDISDPAAIRKFEYERRLFDIEKEADKSDPKSLREASEQVTELKKEFEDVVGESTSRTKNEKAAPSNAASSDPDNTGVAGTVGLSKEEADCVSVGRSMAQHINKSRGVTA